MKFGISIGNFGQFGKRGGAPEQVQIAQRAEALGYDSVWVHDHLFMPARIRARYPYNDSGVAGFAWRQDIYDPLAMMAAVAVRTQRVNIGYQCPHRALSQSAGLGQNAGDPRLPLARPYSARYWCGVDDGGIRGSGDGRLLSDSRPHYGRMDADLHRAVDE